ncbi:hypothetical protein SAMN05216326_12549 [Nitrosomonas marina]|uniref:Uncharacterized protein n=1 Tax=Nitrosomonas marina TaxID=917 RepID=A0A1I0E9F6_9PROT|nr:hypothetical protein [Nitrosomonas marina]SET41046.1 hypothetical protein SAMN05216326_12549 [Nitrosomonas marina]
MFSVIKKTNNGLESTVLKSDLMTRKSARHFCKGIVARANPEPRLVIVHPDGVEEVFQNK